MMKKIFDTRKSFERKAEMEQTKYDSEGNMLPETKEEESYYYALHKASLLTSALLDQIRSTTKEMLFDNPPVWFITLDLNETYFALTTYYGGFIEIILELKVEREFKRRGIKKAIELFR